MGGELINCYFTEKGNVILVIIILGKIKIYSQDK